MRHGQQGCGVEEKTSESDLSKISDSNLSKIFDTDSLTQCELRLAVNNLVAPTNQWQS